MFKLEFQRSIRNRTFLTMILLTILMFLLGLFLLVGFDRVTSPTYAELMYSIYTVYTQFGFLIFSFIVASSINRDYSQKNILYYRFLGFNSFTYYLVKMLLLFCELFLSTTLGLIVVSLFYGNFAEIIQLIYLFGAVSLDYILIIGVFSLIFENILLAIGLSLLYWLLGIIGVSIGGIFKYLAFFDASNILYGDVEVMLGKKEAFLGFSDNIMVLSVIIVTLIICLVVSKFMQKNWFANGI